MASQKIEVIFFVIMAFCGVSISMAADYEVGDSDGWTVAEQVDYGVWAADKNFYVGDTLDFHYSPEYHNVLTVDYPQFQSCNATSPISTYASGSDSITLNKPGNFYFICGFPDHCQAGQKFHIQVAAAPEI